MADRRSEYTVTINGIEHTMLLDEETAEQYGKLHNTKVSKGKPKQAQQDKS